MHTHASGPGTADHSHGALVRLLTLLAVAAATLTVGAVAAPASAAPPTGRPAELQFGRYTAVDPARYQSLAYGDDGRFFFVAGKWRCQIGATNATVACTGRPATAPPGVLGVAISGDLQGPYWIRPGTTFRTGSQTGYRARVLKAGQKITTNAVTCAVPRRDVIACATNNRSFILTRAWHKFSYPRGDRGHSANPKAKYLPKRLR